jgi:putative lipoic acid-binding regulatory protein
MNTKDEFPQEITFKVICKNFPYLKDILFNACGEHAQGITITEKESRRSTFISYTITATFSTPEHIDRLCTAIAHIEGFITMF